MSKMSEDAKHLIELNAQIREAFSAGAVESMMQLLEERRRFLDAIPSAKGGQSPALTSALQEAASDNAVLVSRIKKVAQRARTRGKISAHARSNYNKT
jgi:hypothetical protein